MSGNLIKKNFFNSLTMSNAHKSKKRVTFRKTNENHHIKAVLKELYLQVMGKDVRTAQKLELAMASLSKYPLHLNTGGDCNILQGFDKNLCKYIDEQLSKTNTSTPTISQNNEASSSQSNDGETPLEQVDLLTNAKETKKKSSNQYEDINVTSLFQGILMAIHHKELKDPKSAMSKAELRKCVLGNPSVGNWYFVSELKKMKQYITTEVTDDNELYTLTDKGRDAVLKFKQKDELEMLVEAYNSKDRVPPLCKKHRQLQNCCQPNSGLMIDMPAGSYKVVMLVDKNEPELLRDQGNNQKSESRSLKVGDVLWVARSESHDEELVLPYIVERKRLDDFSSSIKDGRFHEQKFRLRKCGLRNVIYLLEDHADKHCGLSMATLKQALANTCIQDGFLIHCTDSLKSTQRFLNMMTARLAQELEGVNLYGTNSSGGRCLMTLEYFNTESTKSKPLKCRDLFIKMLLQLKGVSVEKALAITKKYSTPKVLMDAYDECTDSREGGLLLANLRFNSASPRVGPAVSKIIYLLFRS